MDGKKKVRKVVFITIVTHQEARIIQQRWGQ